MKRTPILIIVLFVFAAGLFLFSKNDNLGIDNSSPTNAPSGDSDQELKEGTSVGNIAPDFETVDYEGNEIKLSDFRGKPVLVNFWASWCPFCLEEMPIMARVQEKFGDAYITIAIDRAESLEVAKSYTDSLGVTDKYIILLDPKDRIYARYSGFAMPYSLFIDAGGTVKSNKLGPLTESELEEKINLILNQ